MKIRNEQIEALLQQEQKRTKRAGEAGGFDELLSQELGENGQVQDALPVAPPPGARAGVISSLLLQGVEQAEAVSPVQGAGTLSATEAMEDIGGLLDGWDAYAGELGKSGSEGLRSAYSMLEGLDERVRTLREKTPDLAQQHPGLAAMVNDLEVMTTTEKFKFNRGDYLV